MLNLVARDCLMCIVGCILLKEIFRLLQRRTHGTLAMFFRTLAIIAIIMAIVGPVCVVEKAFSTVVAEERYVIADIQEGEDGAGLEMTVENESGAEATITVRPSDIVKIQGEDAFLVIRKYKLGARTYEIEYASACPFSKMLESYRFEQQLLHPNTMTGEEK